MIAVKGMKMPKYCMECLLFDDEYGDCNVMGEPKADMTEERAGNCPLVEIITCKDCKHCITGRRGMMEKRRENDKLMCYRNQSMECRGDRYKTCADCILDQIRKEIEDLPKTYPFVNHFDMYVKVSDVTKIIDKYKTESDYR